MPRLSAVRSVPLLSRFARAGLVTLRQTFVRRSHAWMWTLAFGHHEDRTPTHGYAATREAAMTAFAKSWRRASEAENEPHTYFRREAFAVFS
jgi:hypothetical protein